MSDPTDQLAAAVALHQQGRLDEAEAIYRAILDAAPETADAEHLLGLIMHQRGDHAAALAGIDRAIALNDGVVLYHANRARVLTALGEHERSLSAARRALALEPANPESMSDLAGALLRLGRAPEALEAASKAVALSPGLQAARINLALAHFDVALAAQEAGDLERSEEHYKASLVIDPERVEALVNLGNVYRLHYRVGDAALCYAAALAKGCDLPEVHGNLGVVRQEMGETAEAIACYDRALAVDPENAEIRRNRAQALLKQGNFAEGWREFEWRWRTAHFAPFRRDWAKPRWTGGALAGETVLVHAEQGFGDSLQFARYLPMVAERGARAVVECPAPLVELLRGLDGVDAVVAYGDAIPAHDLQIPMMSLPGAFGTDFDSMPDDVPYLEPADDRVMKWSARLGPPSPGSRRVGLVWKGSANHQRNDWRSPGLEAFRPLAGLDGFEWFSVQKDDEAEDLAAADWDIAPLGRACADFADTAAAIQCLDLVITPDTAVAHLAGALARPVCVVLPYASEWRWFEGRSDSPWYPTMRLFHQPAYGDWAGAVARLREALEAGWP